jgi:hypothetical protein
MDRYAGKPFLRLLECYVLNAIGQLDDGQRAALVKMESKLASVYKVDGGWLDIVSAQMNFPESLPGQINDIWSRYLDQAKVQGMSVDPGEFAMLFVDQNFSDAIS